MVPHPSQAVCSRHQGIHVLSALTRSFTASQVLHVAVQTESYYYVQALEYTLDVSGTYMYMYMYMYIQLTVFSHFKQGALKNTTSLLI